LRCWQVHKHLQQGKGGNRPSKLQLVVPAGQQTIQERKTKGQCK
jgi:hypothetical protein